MEHFSLKNSVLLNEKFQKFAEILKDLPFQRNLRLIAFKELVTKQKITRLRIPENLNGNIEIICENQWKVDFSPNF